MEKRKNFIPDCMIPFIANMRKEREDNKTSEDDGFFEWFKEMFNELWFVRVSNSEATSSYLYLGKDNFYYDNLENLLAEHDTRDAMLRHQPLSCKISAYCKLIDQGEVGEDIYENTYEYNVDISLENYQDFVVTDNPDWIFRGEATEIDEKNGALLDTFTGGEAIADLVRDIADKDSYNEFRASATITFSSGEVVTIDAINFYEDGPKEEEGDPK